MRLIPEPPGGAHGINAQAIPPGALRARSMQLTVVAAAERHGEFVADLTAERPGLRKAQMMRVGGLAAADQAGLRRNVFQMRFITTARDAHNAAAFVRLVAFVV